MRKTVGKRGVRRAKSGGANPKRTPETGDELHARAAAISSNDAIVSKGMKIVAPARNLEDECRRALVWQFKYLLSCKAHDVTADKPPNPTLRATERAAIKLAQLLRAMPPNFAAQLFRRNASKQDGQAEHDYGLRDFLLASTRLAKALRDSTERKRSNYHLISKRDVAWSAFHLLKKFSRKNPTFTLGGPFLRLTSLFYEVVSGVADVRLERSCRQIIQFRRSKVSALTRKRLRS